MVFPRIMRPEIEIEYERLIDRFLAIIPILQVGIKKIKINVLMLDKNMKQVKVDEQTCYIIPKYSFKRRVTNENL